MDVDADRPSPSVCRWAERTTTREWGDDRFRWVIVALDGEEPVGTINTHSCDRQVGSFSYGIALASGAQGQGYGGEAVRLVLRYFFGELCYQKANAGVYAINEPSDRLHEHLGFTLEGRQRRVVFTRGQHSDLLLYGITAEEIAAAHPDYSQ